MVVTSLAKEAPKSALAVEAEGAGYFFIAIFLIAIILGIIFYPAQIESLFSGMFSALIAPFWALISGAGHFFINFIMGILHSVYSNVSKGAVSAGKWVWNNTLGRIPGL